MYCYQHTLKWKDNSLCCQYHIICHGMLQWFSKSIVEVTTIERELAQQIKITLWLHCCAHSHSNNDISGMGEVGAYSFCYHYDDYNYYQNNETLIESGALTRHSCILPPLWWVWCTFKASMARNDLEGLGACLLPHKTLIFLAHNNIMLNQMVLNKGTEAPLAPLVAAPLWSTWMS